MRARWLSGFVNFLDSTMKIQDRAGFRGGLLKLAIWKLCLLVVGQRERFLQAQLVKSCRRGQFELGVGIRDHL